MYNVTADLTDSRTRLTKGLLGLVAAATLMISTPAVEASPMVAQAVSVQQAIVDQFGQPLKGTDKAASAFGIQVVEGAIVQILKATDGVIYPPAMDGTPDSRNELITTTRIGCGVTPNKARPAMFGSTVTPRPGGNSKIFVRVFNESTMDDVSFYGDSQLFTVKSWLNEVFMADVTTTDKALDSNDDDGDGLSNSLEKSLGTDPGEADTDGDGFTDGEEQLAGTDSMDSESALAMAQAQPMAGNMCLTWDSVAGKNYIVEFSSDSLTGTHAFTSVASVVGTGDSMDFVIASGMTTDSGFYRICIVE